MQGQGRCVHVLNIIFCCIIISSPLLALRSGGHPVREEEYVLLIIYSACMHANYVIQGTLTKSSVSMAFLSFVSKIGNTLLDPEKAITPLQTLKRGLGTY
jgi:hypothetical protein